MDLLKAFKTAGTTFEERDYHGRTALHAAVVGGEIPAIRYLCENGACPCSFDNFGISPLQEAKAMERDDILEILNEFLPRNKKPTKNHTLHLKQPPSKPDSTGSAPPTKANPKKHNGILPESPYENYHGRQATFSIGGES